LFDFTLLFACDWKHFSKAKHDSEFQLGLDKDQAEYEQAMHIIMHMY